MTGAPGLIEEMGLKMAGLIIHCSLVIEPALSGKAGNISEARLFASLPAGDPRST